ncbi:MAG: SRPBCC family protein [Acidobacteriia bacterium]|nr:SRPBCC family protein [Terriglobia bacterium]
MTTQLLATLALVLVSTALAQSTTTGTGFKAEGVARTGHLQFEAPIGAVFPLFTPLGEKHWAKGWNPEILFPRDHDVAEGMVFRTQEGVEHVWTVTRYDPAKRTIAYNIVAQGMLVRQIEIRCLAVGANRTDVTVTDSYVGLSAQGNSFVEGLTESAYATKMAHWKESIGGYLAGVAKSSR